MTIEKLLIISLHFSFIVIWKALFCCCTGCSKYPTHLGYRTSFLSRHPTPSMWEPWDLFPSIKLSAGTYISQRNSICLNGRRNSNASGSLETVRALSLEVCHTSISSALHDWRCCRIAWELSFWSKFFGKLPLQWPQAQIKPAGLKLDLVAAVGHSELNPKTGWMYLQKRSQKCLLELSLPCCGNPYYPYWHTGVLNVSRKALLFVFICMYV